MVSDFFYPKTGGVESHIYLLSQCLIERGHKVIVVTHSYGSRTGVRYMTNGLKVYYLPLWVFYENCVLPTLICNLPLFREQITIVHGHSAFSTMAHEGMIQARSMGLKSVFTDHSLFGFADVSAIITNKLLQISLADCNHCICVSHIGKENTVLRAHVPAHLVSVIPNAVDSTVFTPDISQRVFGKMISRLVYRKGIDLLASVIPILCAKHPEVEFIIGGDGPKRIVLEEVREQTKLQKRVQMLGNLDPSEVRNVLIKGDIFLNTSLTEAFCIAILEAAACGLQIVSTNVGGVPEVLPSDMIWLARPNVYEIINALEDAIKVKKANLQVKPNEAHDRIKKMYSWKDVACRTEAVYNKIKKDNVMTFCQRVKHSSKLGPFLSKVYIMLLIIIYITLYILEFLMPKKNIDVCIPFPYKKNSMKYKWKEVNVKSQNINL